MDGLREPIEPPGALSTQTTTENCKKLPTPAKPVLTCTLQDILKLPAEEEDDPIIPAEAITA